jgi:putative ABC transport system substrate-binding protein
VVVAYRWGENEPERLPVLAAELVRHKVSVIASFGSATTLQAKAATETIPIVFNVGDDPTKLGLFDAADGLMVGAWPPSRDLDLELS